jgi:chorismate mutase
MDAHRVTTRAASRQRGFVAAMEFLVGADQAEVPGSDVGSMRARIDALDDAIIDLISTRAHLSRQIQAARISAGEPRIVLSREHAIRSRYLDALGTPGAGVADAVLRVCRGTS